MFRSASVTMHAISMIWSFSISNPVILKKEKKSTEEIKHWKLWENEWEFWFYFFLKFRKFWSIILKKRLSWSLGGFFVLYTWSLIDTLRRFIVITSTWWFHFMVLVAHVSWGWNQLLITGNFTQMDEENLRLYPISPTAFIENYWIIFNVFFPV